MGALSRKILGKPDEDKFFTKACHSTDPDMTMITVCLQVHVHMQGQEALFSENMPLREVIIHFTKQLSAGTSIAANMKTPSWTPQDTSLETGQGE